MRDHWPRVEECFYILGYEVKRFDKDGIELGFTLSPDAKKDKHTSPLVEEIKQHLPQNLPANQRTTTNIYTSLGGLLDEYRGYVETRRAVKKKIIYVLTDGLWQPHSAELLKQSIRNLVSALNQKKWPMDQIGIQFIQFGHDREATELLQKLDKLDKQEGLGRYCSPSFPSTQASPH